MEENFPMGKKPIPHTANAITVGLTNKSGDSDYLAISQKGLNDLAASEGTFTDAPSDGKFYVRKDGAWVELPIKDDAPTDSKLYGRKDGAWEEIQTSVYGA